MWGFTGIYRTDTTILGILAEHIAPVGEVPFLFAKIGSKYHEFIGNFGFPGRMKGVLRSITLCWSDFLVTCFSTGVHLSKENVGALSP